LFEEKNKVVQDHDEVVVHSQQLEEAITKVWSELPELQIPTKVASVEKLQKLAATIKESKVEVGKVRFKLQMYITELQMRLQPTTPLEFYEQHEATIKVDMAPIETIVTYCSTIFEDTMEVWASL